MINVEKVFGQVNRETKYLAPCIAESARSAIRKCWDGSLKIEIFEGFRTPFRQDQLFAQGRTVPGKIVTNSKGWESFHQFGLAIDTAFLDKLSGRWTWEGDYAAATTIFKEFGFQSLAPYEQAHFQMTGGLSAKDAYDFIQRNGLQALWAYVADSLPR